MASRKCKRCGFENEHRFQRCQDCGFLPFLPYVGMKLFPLCAVLFLAYLFFYTIGLALTTQVKDVSVGAIEEEARELADRVLADRQFLPRYKILDKYVIDENGRQKVIQKILVTSEVNEKRLRALLKQLYYAHKARRGFHFQDFPRAIDIYVFQTLEHSLTGLDQWLATLHYENEEEGFYIATNDRQMEYIEKGTEIRYGLEEMDRVSVWRELINLEHRATQESEEVYPRTKNVLGVMPGMQAEFDERYQFEKMLKEKYKEELAMRNSIELDELEDIALEGINKDWPYPKFDD